MPVDEGDDAQGDERILEGEAREIRVGERDAVAGERGEQDRAVAFAVVNVDVELLAGDAELEVEGKVERGEGGDVEVLWHDAAEAAVRVEVLGAEQERLLFAEGVTNLGDGAERAVLGVEAEVERDGVEDVAENAAVREEQNAGVSGERQALGGNPGKEGGFCGEGMGDAVWRLGGEVVAVVEAVEIAAVAAEKPKAFGERVEFVEVEAELEDAVAEMVLLGREAVVHHGAVVEAGAECQALLGFVESLSCRAMLGAPGICSAHSQILAPLTARLQSSAEAKASSWKPYRK